jgi:hypothetical protein
MYASERGLYSVNVDAVIFLNLHLVAVSRCSRVGREILYNKTVLAVLIKRWFVHEISDPELVNKTCGGFATYRGHIVIGSDSTMSESLFINNSFYSFVVSLGAAYLITLVRCVFEATDFPARGSLKILMLLCLTGMSEATEIDFSGCRAIVPPSFSSGPSPESDGGLPIALIAGAAGNAVLLIGIVSEVGYCLYRRANSDSESSGIKLPAEEVGMSVRQPVDEERRRRQSTKKNQASVPGQPRACSLQNEHSSEYYLESLCFRSAIGYLQSDICSL